MKNGFVVYAQEGVYHLSKSKIWQNLNDKNNPSLRYGILCFGRPGTIFKTRRAAERALDRTKIYADLHYMNWRAWLDRSYVAAVSVGA